MEKKYLNKWEIIITMIIGVVGLFVSCKTYEISELQAQIARSSSMPNIVLDEKYRIEEGTQRFNDTIIEISNLDGRLNNYHSEIVRFIECQYIDENNNFYCVDVPVENYYILGTRSDTNTGIIEIRETGGNFSKIELLKNEIFEFNKRETGESLTIELKSFTKISYINLLNEEETLYYESDVFETKKISTWEGEKKFTTYEKFKEQGQTVNPNRIDGIVIEDLLAKISNASEEVKKDSRENVEEQEDKEGMVEIIVACVSVAGTLFAAYFGACWALKNVKKEKYFEERKKIYYELAEILPVIDYLMAQSDYMQDCLIGGKPENKIDIMEIKLKDAEKRLELLKKNEYTSKQRNEIEIEISNWNYRIEKHELYLQEMKSVRGKLEDFEKSGKINILRLFASQEVWNSYIGFRVALDNEYNCNIGVIKEDVVCHIRNTISYMRKDLKNR